MNAAGGGGEVMEEKEEAKATGQGEQGKGFVARQAPGQELTYLERLDGPDL